MTLSDLTQLLILGGPFAWLLLIYLACFFLVGVGTLFLIFAAWVSKIVYPYWRIAR